MRHRLAAVLPLSIFRIWFGDCILDCDNVNKYFIRHRFVTELDALVTRLTPDPDLNQLVRELNEDERPREGERPRDSEPMPMGLVPEGNPLERLLHDMVQRTASDLFLVAGAPPVIRLGGRMTKLESPPLSADEIHDVLMPFLSARIRERGALQNPSDRSVPRTRKDPLRTIAS